MECCSKDLAPLAEVQKHVMKDSARLNSNQRMRAEVVDILRAEAALQMLMDVDGACLSGPKGKEKMKDKGKGKTDDLEGKVKAKGKGKERERYPSLSRVQQAWTSTKGLQYVQGMHC